jgi:GT2 family glycosyltransferase
LAAIGAKAAAPALAAWLGHVPADPVAALDNLHAAVTAGASRVTERLSVVVCTRDRPESLDRCITSLLACEPAADEIIVVDNASTGTATRDLCERLGRVRYVLEPSTGLSRARNAGIAAASGEIIAFTDDDVEVEPSWIAGLRFGFSHDGVASVTGPVLPARLDSDAAFAFEFDYGGLAGGLLPRRFDGQFLRQPFGEAPPVWQVGAGANMAIRRSAFARAGLFDVRLGAGASGCSEDSELWHRLLTAGLECRYEPAAVVHHHHRDDLASLRRQMRAYMRGHSAALMVQFGQSRHPGNLIRAFVGLPAWMTAVAVRHALHGRSTRRSVLPGEVLGLAEGPVEWLLRRRHAGPGEQS